MDQEAVLEYAAELVRIIHIMAFLLSTLVLLSLHCVLLTGKTVLINELTWVRAVIHSRIPPDRRSSPATCLQKGENASGVHCLTLAT